MRLRTFTTPLAAAVAVVVLAACAAAPITHTVDLKAQMAEESTAGTVTAPIVAGEAGAVDLRLPDEDGDCIDFADVAPGATVRAAQLHWVVDATYDGPDLTGKLQARAFAAGAGDEVFHPSHTVGPVFTLNLDKTATRLAGTADLNPTQLAAINDREVCWGVEVWGEDLAAHEEQAALIIQELLPQQMDEAQLSGLIDRIIADTGASSAKEMGKVMAAVMAEGGVQVDGKLASRLVKERLSL